MATLEEDKQPQTFSKLSDYLTSFTRDRSCDLSDTVLTTCDGVVWPLAVSTPDGCSFLSYGPLAFSFLFQLCHKKIHQHARKNNFLTMETTQSISTQSRGGVFR